MDINQIKWCPYTTLEEHTLEIEYLEWHSAMDSNFSKGDVRLIFRSIMFANAKVLQYCCNTDLITTLNYIQKMNSENFEEKLKSVFDELPFGAGISHSKLENILSVVLVPKI